MLPGKLDAVERQFDRGAGTSRCGRGLVHEGRWAAPADLPAAGSTPMSPSSPSMPPSLRPQTRSSLLPGCTARVGAAPGQQRDINLSTKNYAVRDAGVRLGGPSLSPLGRMKRATFPPTAHRAPTPGVGPGSIYVNGLGASEPTAAYLGWGGLQLLTELIRAHHGRADLDARPEEDQEPGAPRQMPPIPPLIVAAGDALALEMGRPRRTDWRR
jgi:hypothetical protein